MAKRVELPLGLRIVVLEKAYVIVKDEVVDFAVRDARSCTHAAIARVSVGALVSSNSCTLQLTAWRCSLWRWKRKGARTSPCRTSVVVMSNETES